MKLAISTYSLSRWRRENNKSLAATIDAYRDLGAEGIEFAGLDDTDKRDPLKRAGQLRKHCERAKLPIVSYCIGAELLAPRDPQRKVIDEVRRQVDVAAALGAPSMR